MRTIGILLAGGQSRRFGSPKAFASIQGEYFYERSCRMLAAVCDEVVIVTREELLLHFPAHMNVMTDCSSVKGKGPLAGIYTAMKAEPADRYLVLPCDMPYLTSTELMTLLHAAISMDVYAVRLDDEYHPLVSSWPNTMLVHIKHALEQEQYSVMKLLESVGAIWLNGEVIFENAYDKLQNINKPDQMKEVSSHDRISKRQIP